MNKDQALQTDRFHYGECTRIIGPRGGVTIKREEWRRNGANREWKRDAARFEIPIKYGIRDYAIINQWNVIRFHAEGDCPLGREDGEQ